MPVAKKTGVAAILADLSKKHDLKIGTASDVLTAVNGLTTGNLGVDYATGVEGLPMGRLVELYGPPSSGKAQPLNAKVLTRKGFVKMGELRVGDELIDPFGQPSVVLGVFPQGVRPVYRLTFSDGSTCDASGDHLWTVEVYVSGFGWVTATVTTEQLVKRIRQTTGRPRVRLPIMQPADLESSGTLPVDPYLLGLLLGDGGMTQRAILFTTKDEELLDAVRTLVPAGCAVEPQSAQRASLSWRINGMARLMRDLGLAGLGSAHKYVPELYKHQPATHRLALLQGLMDTDGHATSGTFNAGYGVGEFSSISEQLSDDVVWLARSLGLKAVRGQPKVGYYRREDGVRVEGKTSYRVRVYEREDARIFRLHRKLKSLADGVHSNRDLASIERLLDAEVQCISVSAPSKLYVTDDFIPTHNTTTALQCAAALQQQIIAKGLDEYILYLDYEQAIDRDYTGALGLDVDHDSFILAQPAYLEQGGEIANTLMSKIHIGLMIVDSVASMAPKALLDGEFDQRTSAMNRARLLNGWLIRLIGQLKEHDSCAVFINHLTEQINMTGPMAGKPSESTPGGKGLKYYASLRLKYAQVRNVLGNVDDALTGGGIKGHTSTIVKVKVTKNKVGPPFREAEVRVRFGKGFDNAWSALQVLVAHNYIKKNGSHYRIDLSKMPDLQHPDFFDIGDGYYSFHGADKMLAFGEANPAWREAFINHAVVLIRAYGGLGLETGDLSGIDADPMAGEDEELA